MKSTGFAGDLMKVIGKYICWKAFYFFIEVKTSKNTFFYNDLKALELKGWKLLGQFD